MQFSAELLLWALAKGNAHVINKRCCGGDQEKARRCLLHTAQEGSIHSVHVLQLVVHTVHTMLQKHQCCYFVGHSACAC